ncbi:hypothetical protein BJ878DRAFT_429778, partial [Calycina marina]
YLLDAGFRGRHVCGDIQHYKSACGLLLYYIWLISYKTDLNIAKEEYLVQ